MRAEIKQVSSLEKIRTLEDIKQQIPSKKVLVKGESFSYQLIFAVEEHNAFELQVSAEGKLREYVQLYSLRNAPMDFPIGPQCEDTDYITRQPGQMPDILVPFAFQKGVQKHFIDFVTVWVEVALPETIEAGTYSVDICFTLKAASNTSSAVEMICETKSMTIEVLDVALPKQELLVTQWFYADCIAAVHDVEIYSDAHWKLIDQYMAEAKSLGINMLLTPVITPPLDTKVGTYRPNVQLVKIEKSGDTYQFDFALLKKWIDMAQKNGIAHFEMAHLFSQWGLEFAPAIYAVENGEEKRIFGWHVPAQDPAYRHFLEQFLPALIAFLEKEGIKEQCFIHISDEPKATSIENYRYAYQIVRPLIGSMKTLDALSELEFYDEGLVDIPVTANNRIGPFLERKIPNQWTYYCCSQHTKVSNRFLAMPSYRNRVIGVQLYQNRIKGFLQWGFNFYYSQLSMYEINPYLTTSADKCFPSGDPFSVYPTKHGPIPSLRAKVFKEAIQDVQLFNLLESYIGQEKVMELIAREAGMDITFDEYPRNAEFLPALNDAVKERLKAFV